MYFEGKELNDIKIDDILFLIKNKIPEDIMLEYKSQCWENNDKGKREMLKDIVSMANAKGGYIILGIEEDEQGDGVPKEIKGIIDDDIVMERIMNVSLACIDEKLVGLESVSIPFDKKKKIVVIKIPKSHRIPHMIKFGGLFQCWRRHGRRKDVMSIDEIRDSCLKVESLREKLEDFIKKRSVKIYDYSRSKPLFFVSATPIIVKDEIIDIFDTGLKDLLKNPPTTRGEKGCNIICCDRHSAGWAPTLHGLKAEIFEYRSMEVLRNGHVEFYTFDVLHEKKYTQDGNTYRIFLDWGIIEYLINFFMFLKKFASYASIYDPFVIHIGLINLKGVGLYERGIPSWDHPGHVPKILKEEEHLIIPPIQLNFIDDPYKITKIFADRIWNGFGFEKTPFFNEEGQFIPME